MYCILKTIGCVERPVNMVTFVSNIVDSRESEQLYTDLQDFIFLLSELQV